MKNKFYNIVIICMALITGLSVVFSCISHSRQTTKLFSQNWHFNFGDVENGQDPSFDDSHWRLIDLPHDWSIEGHFQSEISEDDTPVFKIVNKEWEFSKGDNFRWKDPDLDDSSWQLVELPSTWEEHSDYTHDNVYGWYRRELTIPADLKGKDIFINVILILHSY